MPVYGTNDDYLHVYGFMVKVLIYIKQLISKKQKSSSDKNESALLWN